MAAIDDLNMAVDSAVAAMQHAATTIQTHPAASNDAALQSLASRLTVAASALAVRQRHRRSRASTSHRS